MKRFYVPELDALRFFAFFAVFAYHAHPRPFEYREWGAWGVPLIAGGFGVDLFFALSAFLITRLLLAEEETTGRIHVTWFYVRRILRIWPLYFGFLLLAVLLWAVVPGGMPEPRPPGWLLLSFFGLVGNFALPFAAANLTIGPLWSVCMEEQFYLTWPVALRAVGRRALAPAALALVALSILVRWRLAAAGIVGWPVWSITFARLDCLAAGILVAAVPAERLSALRVPARVGLFAVGVASWLVAAAWRDPSWPVTTPVQGNLGYPLVALGAAAFLASLAGGTGVAVLRTRPLLYLGRISYGLYVFHGVASKTSERLVSAFLQPGLSWAAAHVATAFILTLILAALSYRFWEQRFLRLKGRFTHVASGA